MRHISSPARQGQPIAIEIKDLPGLDTLEEMDSVVRTFPFGQR